MGCGKVFPEILSSTNPPLCYDCHPKCGYPSCERIAVTKIWEPSKCERIRVCDFHDKQMRKGADELNAESVRQWENCKTQPCIECNTPVPENGIATTQFCWRDGKPCLYCRACAPKGRRRLINAEL